MPDILLILSGQKSSATVADTGPVADLHVWLKPHASPLSGSPAASVDPAGLAGLPMELAVGPVTAVGLDFEQFPDATDGYWCLASPVHLRADLSSVLLFGPESLAMTDAEAQTLADTFNTHFADRGLWLGVHSGQGWLLRSEAPLGPALPPVAKASLDIRSLGQEARPWQALLMEIQMLFHGHEINVQRQSKGLPAINGLWPEGCGSLVENDIRGQAAPWVKAVVSDTAWAKGLARVCDLPLLPLDTPMAQGQLWCCAEPSAGLDLLKRAYGWQAAAKGREVWCTFDGSVWRLRKPGLLARLFAGFLDDRTSFQNQWRQNR